MTWWFICFGAVVCVIFGKWYFADTISRLRRTLSKQQRETLELKEALQEARQNHHSLLRQIKGKEIDVSRLRKRLAEQQMELQGKLNSKKNGSKK